jgi:hypothetical protein
MIPFLPSSSDAETLENTFRKLTSEKRQVYKYPFIFDFKILVPVYCTPSSVAGPDWIWIREGKNDTQNRKKFDTVLYLEIGTVHFFSVVFF